MSRIGKLPIELPQGVEAKIEKNTLIVQGPKGKLQQEFLDVVQVKIEDNKIIVAIKDTNSKKEKGFWGLYRSLFMNMVTGVTAGFSKQLEVNGVGYKVSASGNKLVLNLGYSHQIDFQLPEGIQAEVAGKIITITGIDKQLVGETAARIRKLRKPEPYKGKGIKYVDEIIRRKAGKTAAGSAG